ncbi:MAG TPA: glycoside hydrolase family 2, partial [Thermoanaerobaculia bacterium]
MAKRSATHRPRAAAGHGYPRPQLQRDSWTSLNGTWDFVIDAGAHWRTPREVHWNGTITVPFAPETAASGVGDTGFYRRCWYRRTFE